MVSTRRLNLLQFLASDLLPGGEDADGLLDVQDAIAIEVHCVQECLEHLIRDVHFVLLTVLITLFELVSEVPQSVEIDLATVDHYLNDFAFLLQKVLQGAVLFDIAALLLIVLELLKVLHVILNFMEWHVVNIQGLRHVVRRDVIVLVPLVLVELEMPECLVQFVPELHVLLVVDLFLAFENPIAHQPLRLSEYGLLARFENLLLSELSLALVVAQRF